MERIKRLWLLCALVLPLLTACAPHKLPPVVKIGLVAPFEGRYRYIGYDAIYAARLAVREINAQGGVAGQYLELVAYDDRGSPELARIAARNLTIDPAVVAVIGHYRQPSTSAAQEIYATAQLPLLTVGAYLTRTSPYLWSLMPQPELMAETLISVSPASTERVAVWGQDLLARTLRKSLSAANYQLLSATTPQETQKQPEALFSLLPPQETGARWAKWRAAGGSGSLIGDLELSGSAFAELAPLTDGTAAQFITPYPLPQDIAGTEEWLIAYNAVGPHVPPPGPYALPTYEALYLLADALAEANGSLAASLPLATHSGLLGEVTLDKKGYWLTPTFYHYQWQPDKKRALQAILPPAEAGWLRSND